MAAPKKSRKSPRAQVSLVARYRSPTAFEFVQEECFDLSLGGMFIRSPGPAPAGTLIKLECDVNGGAGAIRGVARVVWLREHGSDNQPAGMGVKFVKLEAGAREVIAALLEQLGTESEDRDTFRPSDPPAASAAEGAKGPFRPTPSAPPNDERGSSAPKADASTDSGVRPAPRPADKIAANAQNAPIVASDAARKPDAPSPQPGASSPSESKASKPAKSGKQNKQNKQAKAAKENKPAKAQSPSPSTQLPKAAKADRRAAREAATVPPARTRSNTLVYGGAVALLAAVVLFVVLSQRGSNPSPDATPDPEPAQAAVAAPTEVAPAPVPSYVLEVATNPSGARVTAGDKVLVAPGQIDLGQLDEPMSLSVERDGFEPASATIDRVGFMLEDGAMRRRIELNLVALQAAAPEPTPAPVEPAKAEPAKAEPAKVEPVRTAAVAPAPAVHERAAAREPREPKVKAPRAAKPSVSTPAETAPAVAKTAEPAAAPEPKDTPAAPAPAAAETPMQTAATCLASGDNACVIRALEGKARSARELELLIETYRATSDNAKAEKWMQTYLDKYPTERHANTYRRLLDRRQDEAAAAR